MILAAGLIALSRTVKASCERRGDSETGNANFFSVSNRSDLYCTIFLQFIKRQGEATLYVLPKDSVLPVEDRAIAFPSVCFCVVFIKIQNTAFWQHCIWGECSFSKLTKPLHNRSTDNKVSWLFCRIAPAVENITCGQVLLETIMRVFYKTWKGLLIPINKRNLRIDTAHLTVFLFLCSSGSNARGESRSLEGRRESSKSPCLARWIISSKKPLRGTEAKEVAAYFETMIIVVRPGNA